jgi:hypothetical protein
LQLSEQAQGNPVLTEILDDSGLLDDEYLRSGNCGCLSATWASLCQAWGCTAPQFWGNAAVLAGGCWTLLGPSASLQCMIVTIIGLTIPHPFCAVTLVNPAGLTQTLWRPKGPQLHP